MIITRQQYENLTLEQQNNIEYSNPCITDNPNQLRVGEVLDDDLGFYREARLSDF